MGDGWRMTGLGGDGMAYGVMDDALVMDDGWSDNEMMG